MWKGGPGPCLGMNRLSINCGGGGVDGGRTRKGLVLHGSGYLGKRLEQKFPVPDFGKEGREGPQQVVVESSECQAKMVGCSWCRFHRLQEMEEAGRALKNKVGERAETFL